MRKTVALYLLIAVSASLLFIPFLGAVHLFDWDEINFSECAREMIVNGNYSVVQINFEPFWEKPPLFIWMQTCCMNLFGINEFAARFPNAICGIATLIILFHIGKKIYDKRFGLLWALAFAGSILPHFYFKTAIIDPWFNLFIFLGIYQIIIFLNNPASSKSLILSSVFIGLAILTKGPVALIIFLLCIGIYRFRNRDKQIVNTKHIFIFASTLLATGGGWFIYLFVTGNSKVVIDFILYQARLFSTEDSGHSGFFMYHFFVLLIGGFPASVFAIPSLFGFKDFILKKFNIPQNNSFDTPFQFFFRKWMRILFWVVLILFSLVQTKIIHYSSLCYFPLTFLAAYCIQRIINGEINWKKWQTTLSVMIIIFIGFILIFLPLIDLYKSSLIEFGIIKDLFAVENLNASVNWSGWEWLIGVIFILSNLFFILSKNKWRTFISAMIMIHISILIITPKAEQYIQGAAIEFYESKKNEDCVIETIGYKSYAHYFYANQKENTQHPSKIKMHYFVSKITGEEKVKQDCPKCVEIYRKNGYIFWEGGME